MIPIADDDHGPADLVTSGINLDDRQAVHGAGQFNKSDVFRSAVFKPAGVNDNGFDNDRITVYRKEPVTWFHRLGNMCRAENPVWSDECPGHIGVVVLDDGGRHRKRIGERHEFLVRHVVPRNDRMPDQQRKGYKK
jgi:hypothetical protein